jgi:hypothetical protein
VKLLKAECARVSLILNSSIFSEEESSPSSPLAPSPSASPLNTSVNLQFNHGDTIELYESAIEDARIHGFMQYEALGTISFHYDSL